MAKDVQAALGSALGSASTDREDGAAETGDAEAGERERSSGFKKTFTREEQTEISVKRREMRDRLFADG